MTSSTHAHLFVRGMGLSTRYVLYVLVCLALLGVDARYAFLNGVRGGINTGLLTLQQLLALPWVWSQEVSAFFVTHGEIKQDNTRLRAQMEQLRMRQQDRQSLIDENRHLRELLDLAPRTGGTPLVAEIVQTLPSPFSRMVVIDRGSLRGVQAGWPVVDAEGLVGQVTRSDPLSAEITLLTDRDQAAPVQNQRNGLRLIVSGTGSDRLLEVRFLDMHADVKPGDLLYTSGIDGLYPPGIPVAQVEAVEPPRNTPFAHAKCRPLGGVGVIVRWRCCNRSPMPPGRPRRACPRTRRTSPLPPNLPRLASRQRGNRTDRRWPQRNLSCPKVPNSRRQSRVPGYSSPWRSDRKSVV
jgi:rod shape-determining protein MreC